MKATRGEIRGMTAISVIILAIAAIGAVQIARQREAERTIAPIEASVPDAAALAKAAERARADSTARATATPKPRKTARAKAARRRAPELRDPLSEDNTGRKDNGIQRHDREGNHHIQPQ